MCGPQRIALAPSGPPFHQPTVQYEHTLVGTSGGPLILTLA
jgi:hypothetical protein